MCSLLLVVASCFNVQFEFYLYYRSLAVRLFCLFIAEPRMSIVYTAEQLRALNSSSLNVSRRVRKVLFTLRVWRPSTRSVCDVRRRRHLLRLCHFGGRRPDDRRLEPPAPRRRACRRPPGPRQRCLVVPRYQGRPRK